MRMARIRAWWGHLSLRGKAITALAVLAILAVIGSTGGGNGTATPSQAPAVAAPTTVARATQPPGAPSPSVAPQAAESAAPQSASSTPDIHLPADAAFRQHLSTVSVQLGDDIRIWSEDLSAGDTESATTDAKFFIGDFQTELDWLKAHPAQGCYSGAWDTWQRIVAQSKTVFADYIAKDYGASVDALTKLDTELTTFAINTSCY